LILLNKFSENRARGGPSRLTFDFNPLEDFRVQLHAEFWLWLLTSGGCLQSMDEAGYFRQREGAAWPPGSAVERLARASAQTSSPAA